MADDQNSEAIRRIGNRVDQIGESVAERIDRLADRLSTQIDQIEARSNRRAEIAAAQTESAFAELRRDVGELRDVGHILSGRVDKLEHEGLASAARGAAEGAGTAASAAAKDTALTVAKTTAKGLWASSTGKVIAFSAVIAGLGTGIDNFPKVARWALSLFTFLMTGPPKK